MPENWDGKVRWEERSSKDPIWAHYLMIAVGLFFATFFFVLATKASLQTFSVNGWSVVWSCLSTLGFMVAYIAHITRP